MELIKRQQSQTDWSFGHNLGSSCSWQVPNQFPVANQTPMANMMLGPMKMQIVYVSSFLCFVCGAGSGGWGKAASASEVECVTRQGGRYAWCVESRDMMDSNLCLSWLSLCVAHCFYHQSLKLHTQQEQRGLCRFSVNPLCIFSARPFRVHCEFCVTSL